MTSAEDDLPLLSNINDVRARHYLIHFNTDICSQVISGALIIFFSKTTKCELQGGHCSKDCNCLAEESIGNSTPVSECKSSSNSHIILESCDISVQSVSKVEHNFQEARDYLSLKYKNDTDVFRKWSRKLKQNLIYIQDEWSLKIDVPGTFTNSEFPLVLLIEYETKPSGKSLYWRRHVDQELCCFTPASPINNRSLLPCQDRPSALATWQAWVNVPEGYYVSMTGDQTSIIINLSDIEHDKPCEPYTSKSRFKTFYYYTVMVLPIATIAIAIGKWEVVSLISKEEAKNKQRISDIKLSCSHADYPCHFQSSYEGSLIPVTLVAPEQLRSKAIVILKFIRYCLIACYKLLHRHPFSRLEIAVLPRCFGSLGFASPNLIFLSKSLLIDDASSHIRLAHEISHSWFGINMGTKDWQEEWLSEGFATFLEDIIYAIAVEEQKIDEQVGTNHFVSSYEVKSVLDEYMNLFALRAHIRYLTLLSEQENSSEDLQVLSPVNNDSKSNGVKNRIDVVCNGLNASKPFLQVHYVKGYFLLHFLSQIVSMVSFIGFLKDFVILFHGKLISSLDFLNMFYTNFSFVEEIVSKECILTDWLRNPLINSNIIELFSTICDSNKLNQIVKKHCHFWNTLNESPSKERHNMSNLSKCPEILELLMNHKCIYSDQVVLVLEKLLMKNKIKHSTLRAIHSFYRIPNRNCDIKHRWCELAIKHGFPDLIDIKNFLCEDQCMGVYLYGELMISNKKRYKKLARDIFRSLQEELDDSSRQIISEMIFG